MMNAVSKACKANSAAMSKITTAEIKTSPAVVGLDPWIIVAFVWPLGKLVSVNFVGLVFLQDLISLLLMMILLSQRNLASGLRDLRWVLVLGVLWLVGQIITDLWVNSAFEDYSRGWAKIIFFSFNLAAMWLFLPRRKAYLVAYALGMAIAYRFNVSADYLAEAEGVRWRFGYGEALTFAVATIVSGVVPGTAFLRRFAPALLLLAAFFVLLQSARGQFGIVFAAATLCYFAALLNRRPALRAQLTPAKFALLALLAVFAAQIPITIYSSLADNGALGDDAQMKYRQQIVEGGGNIIKGGRAEINVSLVAIADAPIIGHGSWAQDTYYNSLLRRKLVENGVKLANLPRNMGGLIPSHSFLFGSWVDGGIMGGIFWMMVLILIVKAVYFSLLGPVELMPLFAVAVFNLAWNTFFSPFGSPLRFDVSFQIVMTLYVIVQYKKRLAAQQWTQSRQKLSAANHN